VLFSNTAALNVILSSTAEKGDVNEFDSVWLLFDSLGIAKNSDSYSFAFEVIGKSFGKRNALAKDMLLSRAESLVEKIETDSIPLTVQMSKEYIELLCQLEETDLAAQLLIKLKTNSPESICSKAIFRVAFTQARLGNIVLSQQIQALSPSALKVYLKSSILSYGKKISLKSELEKDKSESVYSR